MQVNLPMPIDIVTDRDLALISALKDVFPTTNNLLCVSHVNKNVLAKYKPFFETKEDWEEFYAAWRKLGLNGRPIKGVQYLKSGLAILPADANQDAQILEKAPEITAALGCKVEKAEK
ncbi:hypothetical protein EPUL_003241 [Erysiphe pulchra]|uniref:MULE transposase domain-containing protein n=1 Tax=Erysiphe pulchra TaxID=225359 RepID=A0A2S4PWL2_9PEZI|nr:hypothetical protein EPUL_003241 [Erysiphe pulchra]